MIQGVLDGLVKRPAPGAPAGLADAIPELKAAQVWEGPWDVAKSPGRLSVACPAALVSLVDLEVAAVGRTLDGRRSLAPPGAAASPSRRTFKAAARPICRLEIAVVLLAGGSGAKERAATVFDLAERALVVMVEHALEQIGGANLNNDALRAKGLSTFALSGYREIEIAPADVARADIDRVSIAENPCRPRQIVYQAEAD